MIEKSKQNVCAGSGYESNLSSNVEKNENLDHDGRVTAKSMTEKRESESTCHLKDKIKTCEGKPNMSDSSTLYDSDVNSEETDKIRFIQAEWGPFKAKPTSSEDGTIKNLSMLHKLIVPKQKKFKVPRKMKEWIDGKFEPSKDDIRKWKQHYSGYFGEIPSMLSQIINPDKMQKYEELMTTAEKLNPPEGNNVILTFKKLLEEQNVDNDKEENFMTTSVNEEIDGDNNSENTAFQDNSVEMNVLSHEKGENEIEVEKIGSNLNIDDGDFQTASEMKCTEKVKKY